MYSTRLYRSSPRWLQEFLISIKNGNRRLLREGRQFQNFLTEATANESLGANELRLYTESTLASVLRTAWQEVPFYRQLYGKPPPDFDDDNRLLEIFAELPMLDKQQVRAAGTTLLSANASRPLFKGNTSGTTGEPLSLKQDLRAINRENAFFMRQLRWAGYQLGDRRAYIRGDMIVPMGQGVPPYWRLNRPENILMLSSYHLSPVSASDYIEALSVWDPSIIQAYPSSIEFLASALRTLNTYYCGTQLSGIVTSSETLHDSQRELIEERFRCRVYDWYGQFERVAAIGTCERGQLHVVDDYGFTEFVPAEHGMHEIVGTGFNNLAMPLIRYRTGDLVRLANQGQRCLCGHHMRLVQEVVGRGDDVVVLPDGRQIGRLDHIFKGIGEILAAQIEQIRIDKLIISIVPGPSFDPTVEQKIIKKARERLGGQIRIVIRRRSQIKRTSAGKYRLVISRLNRGNDIGAGEQKV